MNTNGNAKIIITGSSGQTGSYMVEYLLKNTENLIIGGIRRTSQLIDSNLKESLKNAKFKLVQLQLTDPLSIQNIIEKERPDYFINLGGQTFVADSWNNPVEHMQTNSISLIHILESIRKYSPHCRVYSAGSSEQFGNVKFSPQDETHPMSPRSIYGVSKCAASHICKIYRESYGLYVVHGILFNHESPRRQNYFVTRKISSGISKIIKDIKNNKEIIPIELGNINARRDWSDAEDMVDAIWRMLNQEIYNPSIKKELHNYIETFKNDLCSPTKVDISKFLSTRIREYVVSSDKTHTIQEFVELAFSFAGINGQWEGEGIDAIFTSKHGTLVKINPFFYRPAEVDNLLGDSSKIRSELNWSPKVKFEELVKKMVENDMK